MPVNNAHQAGPSNNNRALMVQVDEGCDWLIQLGNDDHGGIACFVEGVKDLKHACVDEPKFDSCVDLRVKLSDLQGKYDDLQSKYDMTFIHNQNLSKCTEANMIHKNHEKDFKR
ncbi:hypothetical protein Hanom_Chr07g00604431 [Helianthus anomalus]